MKVEELVPRTMPNGNLGQRPDRTHQPHKSIADDQPSDIDSEFITVPTRDRIRFNMLEATNYKAQQIAQQIRQVHESMETIDSYLSEMRVKLEHIVKIYPPYPPGSSERIEVLRQFNALRKMIDQVTRSVGEDGTTSILSAADGPAGGADPGTPNGENNLSIGCQPLHPGRGGLDIPDISVNASDEQLSSALGRTITAQAALQVRRRSFIDDANRIISELS